MHQGRQVDRDDGVHALVVQRGLQRGPELLRRRGGADVDRSLVGQGQPLLQDGVGHQHADRRRVADDRHPAAGRQRLVGQQGAHVEQLGQRLHADHPGRGEQRGDRLLGHRDAGAGQPGGHAHVPAALHRDDGLGAADPAGQPGELARVAEALQVQQHDLGGRVGRPVLQHVVAADVGPVAGRDEARQADAAVAGPLEQHDAERAGLGEEPHPAAAGHPGRQAGVEPDRGVGVDQPQAVGADHPHARRAGGGDQRPLGRPPLGAGLAEPAGDDDQALDPLAPAGLDHPGHLGGRDGEDGQVDVVRDVLDRGVRRHPGDVPDGGVDRVDGAGEALVEQVPEHRVADLAAVVAGAHDGDRARGEQPADRPGLAALLALVGHRQRLLGGRDREGEVDDAVLVGAPRLVAGVQEHPDHAGVLAEHLGDEPGDAPLAGGGGQVLQQHRAQPASLVGVLDEEGDLGVVGARVAVVAADADELLAQQDDEGHPVVVVDVGEPVEVLVAEPLHRPEEPVVAGLVGAALHQPDDAVGVLRGDRAQVHRAAVGGHHVGLPPGRRHRVRRHRRVVGRGASHGGRPGPGRTAGRRRCGCG
ncbi:unannotated protein [freshwater metagenome]|uniref:Unannotated protein n=1 Tax=freshwater metagenome TaxID=449393 RepID=A0A6J7GT76_9ZZZZ